MQNYPTRRRSDPGVDDARQDKTRTQDENARQNMQVEFAPVFAH